jgi:predicted nucleotidyltransferase
VAVTALEEIRGLLDGREDVRLAYVFGSVARGRARPRSDVDVAILFVRESKPSVMDELTEELEDAAGRRVDLIDLATASPLLAHQVVSTGTCIVCRLPRERSAFETRTVLRYLDTAHLRRLQHRYLAKRVQDRHDDRA